METIHQAQANRIFSSLRRTLLNRGLVQKRRDGSLREVSWAGWHYLDDCRAFAFIVDTERLPVPIEKLIDERVAHQMSAALGGRKVQAVNHRGLAFVVSQDPPEPSTTRRRLPKRVNLDLDTSPAGPMLVPLGMGREGEAWEPLLGLDCILIGGVRGYGKTTFLTAALAALLSRHSPNELRLAIADPKGFDFSLFDETPHLWGARATDGGEAIGLLQTLVGEMQARGELYQRLGVRSLQAYNEAAPQRLPLLLVVIDEVTDLMLEAGRQARDLERLLVRLVSKGRAVGIVVWVATQNPKSEVFNTLARGNFGTRIAFWVSEQAMSRTILNRSGAELLPQIPGRMLALIEGQHVEPLTLQGFDITDETVKELVAGLAGRVWSPLTEQERALVRYAVEELGGAFNVDALAAAHEGISRRQVRKVAARFEAAGWLTPAEVGMSRQVTIDLARLSTTRAWDGGDHPRRGRGRK